MNVPVVYLKDQKEFKMAGIILMTATILLFTRDEEKIGSVSFIIIDRGTKSSLEISLNKKSSQKGRITITY